jgi:hypothetical protein
VEAIVRYGSVPLLTFSISKIEIYEQESVVVRVFDTSKIASPTVIST